MEQLLDQIRTWRRHLHAIPEIGFQEYETINSCRGNQRARALCVSLRKYAILISKILKGVLNL